MGFIIFIYLVVLILNILMLILAGQTLMVEMPHDMPKTKQLILTFIWPIWLLKIIFNLINDDTIKPIIDEIKSDTWWDKKD